MSLDDPEVVRAEYADERELEGRRSSLESAEGTDPKAVPWNEITAASPRRILESTMLLKDGIDRVTELDGPVPAGVRTTVFVAGKAA